MKKKSYKFFSIFLVILWAILVFCFSSENSTESENTSNQFTKIIFKNITDEEVENLSFVIRKMAHFTLYTIGGICIYVCVNLNYNKKNCTISFLIGTLYAISDELHQLFVSGRSSQISDVIIDSLGVLVGIAFVKLIQKIISMLRRRGYEKK